jgi:Tol biopolymer transport system component
MQRLLWLAGTLALALGFSAPVDTHPQLLPQAQEELLGEISQKSPLGEISATYSPDRRRVAWIDARGKFAAIVTKAAVVVNTESQAEYGTIMSLSFSPDGQHVAYVARTGKKWRYVLNGQEGPAFNEVTAAAFSPDSRHLAYAARQGKTWTMTIDGELGGVGANASSALWTGLPGFSPDGQRLVYCRWASKEGTTVVLDGKEGPFYHHVHGLVFSADSRRLAYAGVKFVKNGTEGRILVDTQEGPLFKGLPPLVVGRVLLDAPTPQTLYPDLFFEGGHFLTSQVGALAYWVGVEELKRELSPRGLGVSAPIISPDSRAIAYAARRGPGDEVVMMNGEPGPRFGTILTVPRFSPDGAHVAYLAIEDKRQAFEMVDGQKRRSIPFTAADNFASHITFSPDGQRIAYVLGDCDKRPNVGGAGLEARRRVVLDGIEGKPYFTKAVNNLRFSPDGRHLAYEVFESRLGKDKAFVVVDGHEGKAYDDVLWGSLMFSGPAELVYIARDDRRFSRVVQRLE